MHRPGWWGGGGTTAGRPGSSSAQGCCFVCSLSAAAPTPKNHIPGTPENGSITERGRVAECRGRRGGWSKNPGENLFFSGLKETVKVTLVWEENCRLILNFKNESRRMWKCKQTDKLFVFFFCPFVLMCCLVYSVFTVNRGSWRSWTSPQMT